MAQHIAVTGLTRSVGVRVPSVAGTKQLLRPGQAVIVNVDDAAVRKALNAHRSIGQWAVVATNPDVKGVALPTNT